MSKVFLDGWEKYQIHDLGRDDLEGLLRMIKDAKLPERRQFHSLKVELERILAI